MDVGAWIDESGYMTLSPGLALQQGSAAMEVVTPSVTNFYPTNSTIELLVKVISLQEQKIQEQGRKISSCSVELSA